MADVHAEIDQLIKQAEAELAAVTTADGLEQYRIKWLGSKGLVKSKMSLIGLARPEEKKAVGAGLNALKEKVTAGIDAKKQTMTAQGTGVAEVGIDITEPGLRPAIGNRHVVNKVIDELTELFGRMGFAMATGPEVEDEFHNFVALNIPASHPARDPLDNFYLEPWAPAGRKAVDRPLQLLRTQTSTVQIRVMEIQKPPIRVVIPGRVYRPDTMDATHLLMFHQLEALVVDKNVSMVDLKSTIMQFIHAYFGVGLRARFRPSFFPFTEPSAEVDVWNEAKGTWMELGGCGMVHPNVFNACGIDPDEYSGWAFGFGIERIAKQKYGINDDKGIRHFIENDVRFLRQF